MFNKLFIVAIIFHFPYLSVCTEIQNNGTKGLENLIKDNNETFYVVKTSNDVDLIENLELEQRNINGSRVNGGEIVSNIVPFQVSLQMKRRGQWRHFCSGSIVSPNHIVTAAHCVDKIRNLNEISALAGTLSWKEEGDRHALVAKNIHPSFSMDPQIINDIAVVKVTPSFNIHHRRVGTITLSRSTRLGDGIAVRLTGWGSTTPTISQHGLPERLQKLDYYTISNEDCGRKGFKVTWNELCALAPKGKGACVGDSGGPLVTLNGIPELVGIVSYGSATCAQGRPDVYTRVSSFLTYINKVITKDLP